MPVYRASNSAGQSEFVNLDGSARWLGDWVGCHYQAALHRTDAGRWFAGFLTRDGYADLTGYPLLSEDGHPMLSEDGRTVYPRLIEATADGAATWFDSNRIAIPDELVAALSAPPAPTLAVEPGRTAGPSEGTKPAADAAKGLDDLTPNAWKLLAAIRDLDAVDSGMATTQPKIVAKATRKRGNHDSKHHQLAFGQLSGLGLIASKQRVGTWITDAGIQALDKRSKTG